ncbi:MAG: glycosyltransferase family A protein, partial [Kovacikia sp.]
PYNLGGQVNQNRTIELAQGEYFKLAAHDDLLAPEFLEKCVAVLEHNPSVVLAYPKTKVIDQNGSFLASNEDYVQSTNANQKMRTELEKTHERFHDLSCNLYSCYQIFGVMRTSALKSIPSFGSYAGSDKAFLARISLLGRYHQLPDYLFFLRRHSGQSINIGIRSCYLYNIWYDTSNQGKIVLPAWMAIGEYLSAIRLSPLNLQDRIRCYLEVFNVMLVSSDRLIKDLFVATLQVAERAISDLM